MIAKDMKIYINLLFLYCVCLMCTTVRGNYLKDNYPKSVIEDASLDTAQLIRKYQYPVETHYVTTADKYILRLHRIPKPKAPPVLLMHGLEDSSSVWIIMGPEKAPGYYLSDNGYDVWMGNARGNRYSRNHTILNPDRDTKFWKFSWHEIGFFDLPAMIDYVLEQTGYKKTGYFGHSQGTTSFWVLCSMQPEYNNKITMMHALAPTAFLTHAKSPILQLAKSIAVKPNVLSEMFPHHDVFHKMVFTSKTSAHLFVELYYQFLGRDYQQTNVTMFPTIFGHLPAGSSFQQFEHYRQILVSNRFCQYDYGRAENMKRYGTSLPPEYPLEKITAPVGLYYTYNDIILNVWDVKRLAKMLPNVVENKLYPHKTWNHVAMIWGIDARELAHKRMLKVMKNYPYE